ncbi:MAG: hypothetical protein ACLTT1_11485 [[Clostridium] scindens]
MGDARAKIEDGKSQIADAKATLNSKQKELDNAKAEYEAGLAKFQEGKAAYEQGAAEFAAGKPAAQEQNPGREKKGWAVFRRQLDQGWSGWQLEPSGEHKRDGEGQSHGSIGARI